MTRAALSSIPEILEDLRRGKLVILVDDEDRENEGDLVCAAEAVTPEMVNFMTRHTPGYLCVALDQTQLEDAAIVSEPHPTAELVEQREELEEVLAGVANLPDDRREALIMRFALDMDNREIARALGRTEGATKVLIHRAIRQLDESLKAGERT